MKSYCTSIGVHTACQWAVNYLTLDKTWKLEGAKISSHLFVFVEFTIWRRKSWTFQWPQSFIYNNVSFFADSIRPQCPLRGCRWLSDSICLQAEGSTRRSRPDWWILEATDRWQATHPEVPKCWPDSRSLTFGWTLGLPAGFRPSSPCPPPDTAQLAPSRCSGPHFIHPELVPVSADCPNSFLIFFFSFRHLRCCEPVCQSGGIITLMLSQLAFQLQSL